MGDTVIEGPMVAIGSSGRGDIESVQVKVMDGYPVTFKMMTAIGKTDTIADIMNLTIRDLKIACLFDPDGIVFPVTYLQTI